MIKLSDYRTYRTYYSTDEHPVESSTSITYGTLGAFEIERVSEPERIKGWPDRYMARFRVNPGDQPKQPVWLGCNEKGAPTVLPGT